MSVRLTHPKLRLEFVLLVCAAVLGLLMFYEFYAQIGSGDFESHLRLISRIP